VETDDPRWIDFTKQWVSLSDKAHWLACQLLATENLSLPGATALLAYAIEHVDAGYVWPDGLVCEGRAVDWAPT
jgi:hypothetical protein